MDTTQVADHLNTTARQLRQFLRSPWSTYVAVGSGARYEFKPSDMPTLEKRFAEWRAEGRSRVTDAAPSPRSTKATSRKAPSPRASRDRAVWDEEGAVVVPDIRDPRVRARVRADAAAQEARLEMMLLAAGLHITQLGDRKSA